MLVKNTDDITPIVVVFKSGIIDGAPVVGVVFDVEEELGVGVSEVVAVVVIFVIVSDIVVVAVVESKS